MAGVRAAGADGGSVAQRARGLALVALVALAPLVALVAAVAALPAGAGGHPATRRARGAQSVPLPRPLLLSLRYGRFRPSGAPHSYFALRLRARQPRGQILEVRYVELPHGLAA